MTDSSLKRVSIIDSHTGGEPTRVVINGGPDLGTGDLSLRLERFRSRHDSFRSAVVNEPRGSDVQVGALLCEPEDQGCCAGVIFFNNVGYLGMCGHGTIGLVKTLAYLKRIGPGEHRIETPVGEVTARLHETGKVTVNNIVSYRYRKQVEIDVAGYGKLKGDIAWGGNWFFLVTDHGLQVRFKNIEALTDCAWHTRKELEAKGIRGENGQEIDHIELFGPPGSDQADSRSFVLCPGNAYDRSPCGTGTSAKMACLYADGKLLPGQVWRQESIVGSIFEGSISVNEGKLYPSITGSAFINAESVLILDPADPFCYGIRA
ncbi:MAG: proline racemase family protein [Deltaproteobacteria bacterium]|nr:proline racemase family protein [Deltaproteobacteria bacterium]